MIERALATSWKAASKYLGEWKNLFELTNNTGNKTKNEKGNIPFADLVSELQDKQVKLAHKRPGKRKHEKTDLVDIDIKDLSEHQRILTQEAMAATTPEDLRILMVRALTEMNDKLSLYL